MLNFDIKCSLCGSDDIVLFQRKLTMLTDELALRCNNCKNEEGTE